MTDLDRLDATRVRETVVRLEQRVAARFAGRGIVRVVGRVGELVAELEGTTPGINRQLRRTRVVSRVLAGVVLLATVVGLAIALRDAAGWGDGDGVGRSTDWLPLIETTINDVVFAAIALWFLYSIPDRLQRGRSLALLHRLRSLAHVVDMHQLTKDPERFRADYVGTPSSVDPRLGATEMVHYLEYCSEILSLLGKAAALVAEESRDALVLDAVGDLETLTTSLSRKIWQKISMLDRA
ncbi:hypothetical protein FE634_02995 [Nocardioides dongxiaopingii]|uniref:hypothetical protein n=1 Tax=Nocardioides sp. S-1144 TaxID=2582905 RepID=UPI00110F6538|nr:hypothetical protein [Nocardioides sp. S-1144]QCW49637.1 hypothetical protein FE634_02995 [Nocardioides sp. S-1144]